MTPQFDRAEFYTQLGKRLRQWRDHRGMSQLVLAHRSGFVPQTISNIERGFSHTTLSAVFVLAECLEVHPKTLMFGEEE